MRDLSEKELISGLKVGNLKSYEVLFQLKYNTFYTYIKGFVKDCWIAEDITQNIFMKVWIHRNNLNPELSIHSYLYVLAKNEIYNYFREKSKQLSFNAIDVNSHVCNDLEDQYNAKEIEEKVAYAVSEMSAQRREIFRLSRIEHLSNKEIAERLNISVRTVEKHIELALKDLRKMLGAFNSFLLTIFW